MYFTPLPLCEDCVSTVKKACFFGEGRERKGKGEEEEGDVRLFHVFGEIAIHDKLCDVIVVLN